MPTADMAICRPTYGHTQVHASRVGVEANMGNVWSVRPSASTARCTQWNTS